MARVTVDDCLKHINNRFDLVMAAAKRAHQLSNGGHKSTLDANGDKPTVIALREIEKGIIDSSILKEEDFGFASFDTDSDAMKEVREELDHTAIDTEVDQLSEVSK